MLLRLRPAHRLLEVLLASLQTVVQVQQAAAQVQQAAVVAAVVLVAVAKPVQLAAKAEARRSKELRL